MVAATPRRRLPWCARARRSGRERMRPIGERAAALNAPQVVTRHSSAMPESHKARTTMQRLLLQTRKENFTSNIITRCGDNLVFIICNMKEVHFWSLTSHLSYQTCAAREPHRDQGFVYHGGRCRVSAPTASAYNTTHYWFGFFLGFFLLLLVEQS